MGVCWGQIDPMATKKDAFASTVRGKRQIPGQKNTIRWKVQMSPQEYATLLAASIKARMSLSNFIVNAALDKAERTDPEK